MNIRRLLGICGLLVAMSCAVLCRVFWLSTDTVYAANADAQTEKKVEIPRQRGDFVDRRGRLLTGVTPQWYALCLPGEVGYTMLFPYVSLSVQAELYRQRNTTLPFFVTVDRDLTAQGVYTVKGVKRYLDSPIAAHLLGHLDSEGHGIAGLEKAYDDILFTANASEVVSCATTAQGELLYEDAYLRQTAEDGAGQAIQLTLDANIQRACEGIADETMERGCILVMETSTGNVLACVSRPEFDPNAVGESIRADDTSLIDRAFASFNAGSVFKVVSAVAAYENGLDWYTWDCEGSTEIAGTSYRCAQGRAHGTVNLRGALEESCNCYFIHLAQLLGGDILLETAKRLGFGSACTVAPGLKSSAGDIPAAEQLENPAQLAMFSFGQGELTVTPLQITAMMNVIADGGEYLTPRFVEGIRQKDGILSAAETALPQTVCPANTARILRSMLVTVVEDGIGDDAKPQEGSAGGKTGTAQTGRMDINGDELLNYWFCGFWPGDAPLYTITVLQDGTTKPRVSSAKIFSLTADALHVLETS